MGEESDLETFREKAQEFYDAAVVRDGSPDVDLLMKASRYTNLWIRAAETKTERHHAQQHLAMVCFMQGNLGVAKNLAESILRSDSSHFGAYRILYWLACHELSVQSPPNLNSGSLIVDVGKVLIIRQRIASIRKRIIDRAFSMVRSFTHSWNLPAITGSELLIMTDVLLNEVAPHLEQLNAFKEAQLIYETILKAPLVQHSSSLNELGKEKMRELVNEARGALDQPR